ncbi:MAG: hypothetical protein KatS3mg071_2755 [Meiothermus sp.]|nr:MAG: hypothetical protein KatS3mg071_2755 [Meiothermus sp.]
MTEAETSTTAMLTAHAQRVARARKIFDQLGGTIEAFGPGQVWIKFQGYDRVGSEHMLPWHVLQLVERYIWKGAA